MLNIKDKNAARFDLVSLGEILLRFDPGEARINRARSFAVWDGGAEYNVAANLSRVFHQRTTIATALFDNSVGRLAEDLARQSGVDLSNILWRNEGRNGLYFIERGFGVRAPASAFDRDNTAISRIAADDHNWSRIFGEGVRWFHTGGIFTGLSDTTPAVAKAAMSAARENGCVVSYDLNYRDSLWKNRGGRDAANELNSQLLPLVDVVFGTFDFDPRLSIFEVDTFAAAGRRMLTYFPNLKIIVSTLRETRTASSHDLGAACFADGGVHVGTERTNINIYDRVGSGDAFAAGFMYALLEGKGTQFALDCGTAHGALSMTTPGDVSMASVNEVIGLMQGESSVAKR